MAGEVLLLRKEGKREIKEEKDRDQEGGCGLTLFCVGKGGKRQTWSTKQKQPGTNTLTSRTFLALD